MRPEYPETPWQSPTSFWLRLLQRNIPLLLFLFVALAGMLAVYWYFSPISGEVTALAAASAEDNLSAPISKIVPARPVTQRLPQSQGALKIALVSGHRGNDSGAVCADGLTEAAVVERIANQVSANLQAQGIPVEILDEFDPRLQGYSGTALVSIHADSCDYYNELATGYKVAGSSFTDSSALSVCVEQAYFDATQMPYHANTITPHMTDYHAFREIAVGTQAIIIEVGFMNLDREMLTTSADRPTTGLTNGILCYLRAIGRLQG